MASGDVILLLDDHVVPCDQCLMEMPKPLTRDSNCRLGGIGGLTANEPALSTFDMVEFWYEVLVESEQAPYWSRVTPQITVRCLFRSVGQVRSISSLAASAASGAMSSTTFTSLRKMPVMARPRTTAFATAVPEVTRSSWTRRDRAQPLLGHEGEIRQVQGKVVRWSGRDTASTSSACDVAGGRISLLYMR